MIYHEKKQETKRIELFKATFDKPTGYLGYIYQYKPKWEVDEQNNEHLSFDIGNVFLEDQVPIKKWLINPSTFEITTILKSI